MPVFATKPKFLYPTSRQFLFDEVIEKIVRAIEKRNWKVKGLTIKFDTYGSGEAKYQMIRNIIGNDFQLHFCRCQGRLNERWNDTAAIEEICIPKQIISVYDDESGPNYYLYVGKDWEADKDAFMNSLKVHSKLDNKPRTYLQYSGNGCHVRPLELIADNDLGREYDPEGDEPTRLNLNKVFKTFTTWIEKNVLSYILSFPEADIIEAPVPEEKIIPYDGPWPMVYSTCQWKEVERIEKGKNNPAELHPEDRHACFGNGRRLVPLDVRRDERFPKIAYEGFIWCDINQDITKNSEKNDLADYIGWYDDKYIVAIRLKYANHVYVAEHAEYVETRERLFEEISPRERLTDSELGNAFSARGKTIVPITEYKEDYKIPIVLINRELDFDEIEWVADTDKDNTL